jgi:hypothetical protein
VLLFLTIYRRSACQSDGLRFSVRFESSSQNQKPKTKKLVSLRAGYGHNIHLTEAERTNSAPIKLRLEAEKSSAN